MLFRSYTDVETIISQNSLIKLANNNIASDVVDIGFYGESNNGTDVVLTGLFRHAGDAGKNYYLFDGYTGTDPITGDFTIDPNNPSFHLSTLKANIDGRLVQSDAFLANEGSPDGYGGQGYSFKNDGGFDTGMFSQKDGSIQLWTNNNIALNINPDNDGTSLGFQAGLTNQGYKAIALGYQAADTNQGNFAVAVGSDLDLDLVEHHLQRGLLIQLVVTLHHLARIVFLAIMQ